MANKLEKANRIILVLLILLIISISFNAYLLITSSKKTTDFFKDYVVAINDYHVASSYFDLANANLDNGNWYSSQVDYYYETAIDYYDISKEQLTISKEFLIHAKQKINAVKNMAPNTFYQEEMDNRIEQIDILVDLDNQFYLLNDYMASELYEINYGSETEATRYYNLYNDLISEVNVNLKKLSDISQEIDLAWDNNWYPLFEGIE